MATTPNLGITQVAPNQASKEITINDGLTNLDKALTDVTSIDIATADYALPLATLQRAIVVAVTNTGAVKRTVTLPIAKRLFVFRNADTTNPVAIARGTTSMDVAANTSVIVYLDGTTNGLYAVSSGGGGGASTFLQLSDTPSAYGTAGQVVKVNAGANGLEFGTVSGADIEVATFVGGKPGNSELVNVFVAAGAFSLPSGLTGSSASAGTAATAAASITITKNGASIGSVNFAAGQTVGTFTFTAQTAFSAGDRLGFVAQATADATLADIAVTLKGARS